MPRRLLVAWLPAAVAVLVAPADLRAEARTQPRTATGGLELRLGLGRRNDALAVGRTQASADGSALSDLALSGVWFGGRTHLGLAVRAGFERFALHAAAGAPAVAPEQVVVTGLQARGGLALRSQAWLAGHLRLSGQLGYGVFQLPVVFVDQSAGTVALAGGALRAHGPGVSLGLALALPAGLGLELEAEALPVGFGADYGGVAVDPRRFGGRAGLSVALLPVAGAELSGVLSAELSRASASGGGVDITQTRQQIALGVRATWLAPTQVVRLPPPPPPRPPPPLPPPPPVSSVITGLVRSETGQPLAARVRIVELALETAVDEQGSFALEIPPGQYTLVIEAEGFVAQTKEIRAGSGEQNIYNVDLHAEAP